MIAIIKMSGKFYGRDLSNFDSDEVIEYVESFTFQGEAVTLVNCIEGACDLFDIEESDIEIIYEH